MSRPSVRQGAQFVSDFNQMKNTIKYDANGNVAWCSPEVDGAGRPLYQYTYNGKSVCLGSQPQGYTALNISDMAGACVVLPAPLSCFLY